MTIKFLKFILATLLTIALLLFFNSCSNYAPGIYIEQEIRASTVGKGWIMETTVYDKRIFNRLTMPNQYTFYSKTPITESEKRAEWERAEQYVENYAAVVEPYKKSKKVR